MSPFLPTPPTSARSTTRISGTRSCASERLLVAVEAAGGRRAGRRVRRLAALVATARVGLLAVGRRAPAALPALAALAAAPVGLLRAGDGPAHARPDLVGDDLDLRALLAVLGLPGPLLEPPGHDHPVAFAERVGDVGAEVAPAHDVEEGRGLLPGLALAVLPAAVDSDAERGDRLAAGGVAQFGVTRDVADQGDVAGHGFTLPWVRMAPPPAPRRSPRARGRGVGPGRQCCPGPGSPCGGALRPRGRGRGPSRPSPAARRWPRGG